MVRWLAIFLVLGWLLPGCGEDDTTAPVDPGVDAAGADASDDGGEVCEFPCLNEFEKNDKKLCPDPKSDWSCTDGCCIPVFKCTDDASCASQGFDEGHCWDDRFACRCDVDSGQCFTWYCAVAADCADGEVCEAGTCLTPEPPAEGGELHILQGPRMLAPGTTGAFVAERWLSATGPVDEQAVIQWESDSPDVISVDDQGVATGGSTTGWATITATTGDLEPATWRLANVVDGEGATLTALVLVAGTSEPVVGSYAAVDAESGDVLEVGVLPEDGVVQFTASGAKGVDLHIFGDDTDWMSWLGGTGTVYLPVPATAWSAIAVTQDLDLLEEGTNLTHTNILRGRIDYTLYPKDGEFELTLNSFPLSSGLFDFSLETLLGPDVERYFDEGHSIPGVDQTEEAQIPGGLTFSLATPAIPEFHLGARTRDRRVWTLGGRIDFDQIAEYTDTLFEAFGGSSLDFNVLVGALFPTFAEFWSALTPFEAVAGNGDSSIQEINVELEVPLGIQSLVTVPDLPAMERKTAVPGTCDDEAAASCSEDGDCADGVACKGVKEAGMLGWADAVFMLHGAVTSDALFVPLGLNAGSDTSDPDVNPEDGIADSNEKTEEQDPYLVPCAPLHSGLASANNGYGLAVVAASIRADEDDPRPEGGSAILHRYPAGEGPGAEVTVGEFLNFPMDSAWDASSRTVTVGAVEGSETQRILFKGRSGQHWTVWMNGASEVVMPDHHQILGLADDEEKQDRTENVSLILVNSFDFAPGLDLDTLAGAGVENLADLILSVERASFVDIRP